MAVEDPTGDFTDHLHMINPLLYDANGMPTDEETSYAWACVKYARDVTPKHPSKTYVQRAQMAFRDRWLVAPRRRAQNPAQSPFWPRDKYFARGHQADLPWLADKEFQRQNDRTIYVSQEFIKRAKAEMGAESSALHRNELWQSGCTNQMIDIITSNHSIDVGYMERGSTSHQLHHQSRYRYPNIPHDMNGYKLPPLQIRDRYGASASSKHSNRPPPLPSVQYILHYRH